MHTENFRLRTLVFWYTQDMYNNDRRIWNALFLEFVKDLAKMEQEGVHLGLHGRVYPIILGNKGDWSYLAPRSNVFRHLAA